jgi:hypothetical protein
MHTLFFGGRSGKIICLIDRELLVLIRYPHRRQTTLLPHHVKEPSPGEYTGQLQDMDNDDTAGKSQRTSYHVDNEIQKTFDTGFHDFSVHSFTFIFHLRQVSFGAFVSGK